MNNTINVEEIMQNIRNEIKEKGYSYADLSFEDKWKIQEDIQGDDVKKELYALLNELENRRCISYYRELSGNPFKKFIKRVIRKMNAFLMMPIVDEQNMFNESVCNLCRKIIENM